MVKNVTMIRLTKRNKLCLGIFLAFILYIFGVFTHLFELDYYENFEYPLDINLTDCIEGYKHGEPCTTLPINNYNFPFISKCEQKCASYNEKEQIQVVYMVKSALRHFDRRKAIRQSWGYERRFSDVPIVTVFVLGYAPEDKELQKEIEAEQKKFGDIVQAKFIDTYYNNTIKTMIGFKWAANYCKHSKFYLFADDDFYVSTRNVLRFIRNPLQYPEYLELPIETIQIRNNILDYELPPHVKLFSGFVFVSSPHRHYTSKWYISLDEYPYHLWPPYVTAGAYIVSKEVLLDFYFASHFIKHFRFDDIYLGILAKKSNIEPFHCEEFYFYKKDYSRHNYQYVIASHGYSDPDELLRIWNEQRSLGNA
uniref:Hexosyltransferase n=1 Tax=Cacopsylla melanoneura TaxID=428564 RepID=A0A8D8M1V9_9HEMI